MSRLLLLRATEEESVEAFPDVDVLVTHAIERVPSGVNAFQETPAAGATLVVTSKTTVRVLQRVALGSLRREWRAAWAAGNETARELESAGVAGVQVPSRPGAAGIVEVLGIEPAGLQIVWPRGSDADPLPFRTLTSRGARLIDLVVYQKVPRTALDDGFLTGLASGRYRGVAVTSLAALDALLGALSGRGLVLPSLTWGVIGPATARSFASRGLPDPVVPHRTSINDLISLLRET